MKIVADPNIPFVREAFGPLGEVALVPGRDMTPAAVVDADALLVRSVTPVNAALLAHSRVRFVATATIGTDHVDEPWLREHGIGFASAAGSNANSVAEYVIAALLELAGDRQQRLRGQTLGVIGVGNVGRKVVRYAEALGMRVLPNDPPRARAEGASEFVDLEELLTASDIVTCHVPLMRSGPDATHHLLGRDRLGSFTLINTARGAVVDNRALLTTDLPGLVLDVWEGEPRILPGLIEKTDIATPHIAGYSFDGKVNGTVMIYRALCAHFGVAAAWQPAMPAGQSLTVRVTDGEDEEAVLRRVVRQCYAIRQDDAALRADVGQFDQLRARYPMRREWFNTTLTLTGAFPAGLRHKLAALGFKWAD